MTDKISKRDSLRSKLFAGNKGKTKIFDWDGVKIELHQPTVGEIMKMQDNKDDKSVLVDAIIRHCYVPGTKDKVFEPTDVDGIMEMPIGDWLTNFNNALSDLSGINVEVSEKN
jgi:hypothetical protein